MSAGMSTSSASASRGLLRFEVEIAGRVRRLRIVKTGQDLDLFEGGRHVHVAHGATEDALQAADLADAGSLVTPLPGTVVAVHVSTGQRVARGAPLMTIEAMKMEHTVTAPYAGMVERLPFGLADRVTEGAILVELSLRGQVCRAAPDYHVNDKIWVRRRDGRSFSGPP